MNIFTLGRQPEISLAELKAVFGDKKVIQVFSDIALVDSDFPGGFKPEWLGGSIKVAIVIAELNNFSQAEISKAIADRLKKDGKNTLGLSGHGVKLADLQKIKKTLRAVAEKRNSGSIRLVPNKTPELSSAQVLHNKLAKGGNKFEFIIVQTNERKIIVAQTFHVQDITAYTFRDRERPCRDARVGMLPPKLAQTMINLATGSAKNGLLLDAFCGTGVVLQEAALMGLDVYGTDIEQRMIDFSTKNLDWLSKNRYNRSFIKSYKFEVGDATNYTWSPKPSFVVSETYLGQPYSSPPPEDKLRENITTCNTIIEKFLKNLRSQTDAKTKICLAVPVWFVRGRTYHLPVVKKLSDLGFANQISPLIYHREDQLVGRELLVLAKD